MNEVRYRQAERRLWESLGVTPTEQRVRLTRTNIMVRVQELGHGPAVVLLHGTSNSGASWAPLVARLDGFHCVVLDRPGCGLSDPLATRFADLERLSSFADTLVVDLLDAMGLDRAHLVATSFGGYLALRAAAAHPDRAAGTFMALPGWAARCGLGGMGRGRRPGRWGPGGSRWRRLPGVGVAGKAREGGAGHLHPDAVAAVEAVAGRPRVHLHAPHALGVGGDLRGQDPTDAVADVHRPAPGIHVAQAHHHVGVLHAGAHVHPGGDRAHHLQRHCQRIGGEDQHVRARLDPVLEPRGRQWAALVGAGGRPQQGGQVAAGTRTCSRCRSATGRRGSDPGSP
jgi:pimeloyl-ACP methyl ester carboxylesterase